MFSRYKLAFRYELNTCVANSGYPCATSGLSSLFSNFSECVVHFGCRCQGTSIVRRKDFSYSYLISAYSYLCISRFDNRKTTFDLYNIVIDLVLGTS